jgi:CheY-like chemotaxis protein
MLPNKRVPMAPCFSSGLTPRWSPAPRAHPVQLRPTCFDPVLIIMDDYPPGQRLLSALCTQAGLRTTVCASMTGVASVMRTSTVAAIIIDTDTHDMGWMAFVAALRAAEDSVPVIALHAAVARRRCEEKDVGGITAELRKPICVSDFYRTLDRWVSPRLENLRMTWHMQEALLTPDAVLNFG